MKKISDYFEATEFKFVFVIMPKNNVSDDNVHGNN